MSPLPAPPAPASPQVRDLRWWVAAAVLAALYFATARLGLQLASLHDNASPVWPATGLALSALVARGRGLWPAILLGAFAANAITKIPAWVALMIAAGNTAEAYLGAVCVEKIQHWLRRWPLAQAAGICGAAAVGPAMSAGVGVAALLLSGNLPPAAAGAVATTWWVGDALGALAVAPALLALAKRPGIWLRLTARKLGVALALAAVGAALAYLIFFRPGGTVFLFLVFPWLFAVSAVLHAEGAQAGALALTTCAVAGTSMGMGPFSGGTLNQDLLHLQLFLASVALTGMALPVFRLRQGWWLPTAVLFAGWSLSGWLFATLENDRRDLDRRRFTALTEAAERDVVQRLQTYEDALRGAASLFSVEREVDAARWRTYVETLKLVERYPGVYGIGVIFPVRWTDEETFVAKQRARGMPQFAVHAVPGAKPPPPLDERFVITLLEPIERNLPARGLDIASEESRRSAALASRDSGAPRLTRPVALVQDGKARPGFMFFLPMYRENLPARTTEDRRAASTGWVYAPFVMEELVRGALAGRSGELNLEVFHRDTDEFGNTRENLIGAFGASPRAGSGAGSGVKRENLRALLGQTFVFSWSPGAELVRAPNTASAWAAACAAVVSLLMAGLVVSLQSTSRRAGAMVDERTAELAASEARTRAIVETALDAVVTLNRDGLIEAWNSPAEKIFGWRTASARGQPLIELIVPERFTRVRALGFRRFAEGRAARLLSRRMEITAVDRGGREFPCEIAIATLPQPGADGAAFSVFLRDISERRKAERDLVQAKEAAEAGTRAKSEFLATMSHEIRTPMNGVIGFTRLLLDTPLAPRQREFAAIIESSAGDLMELIDDILDLSKIEAGKLTFESIPFDLGHVMEKVMRLLSPRAAEKRLTLALDYPPTAPRHLIGDPARVRQILLNLAGNAVKFTAAGSVRIIVRRVGATLRVEVRDTGPGIPASKQTALFQKFSQGDSSTTRKFGGSGLGLAIARNLVENMGGAIGVESSEGEGSTFWFTLPLAKSAEDSAPKATPAPPSPPPPMPVHAPSHAPDAIAAPPPKIHTANPWRETEERLRVLVAEDNAINQLLARAYLESMGCVVDIVPSGAEAVTATARETYDGVLMDCHMPDLDGFLATRAIREREAVVPGTPRLPLVALTASAMEGDRERSLAAGMDDHIVKPVRAEDLRRILDAWREARRLRLGR